jgi:DNA/RNA-binding domain of Phe-tRNA-synthetase-like protein
MRLPRFNIFEAKIKEDSATYNPSEHAAQLARRKKQDTERYKAAQERGDNYAIKYYELRLKLDDIDVEKMKTRAAIQQLKKKFKRI